jgi:hypothetical protein
MVSINQNEKQTTRTSNKGMHSESNSEEIKPAKRRQGSNDTDKFEHTSTKIKQMRQLHAVEMHETTAYINFAVKKSAKMVHSCEKRYNIGQQTTEELSFLQKSFEKRLGNNLGEPNHTYH